MGEGIEMDDLDVLVVSDVHDEHAVVLVPFVRLLVGF